ncbi:Glycosyltransferase involved in cell wall bisynthesis [Enhydrobacter aerosaccus]|uniref:Glycosyltransferase involved in cell wall bisynthesis n=1 Tax=Enhydrobacter aerosaccus TaxID=225324 RepID=A0A1T4SCN0_9HYPH|nr:glycosyltransferase family 1 protein [Enhydrobacter aerosaccus]SKA25945.1 Glycosyltransferase involved in cell wall bisynthesis [Enhydrobacter aerosaccus]
MPRRFLFDVTGLLHWYAYFSNPSGIQRVTEGLLRSVPFRQSETVEYVARGLGGSTFYKIDPAAFGHPAQLRALFVRSMRGAQPAALMADMWWYHLPYLGLGLSACLLPALQSVAPPGPDDTLFNPGDLWWQPRYAPFTLELKARTSVRVVQMVHDLFVIDRPDWFGRSFVSTFVSTFTRIAPAVDRWVTNSHYVKDRLEKWLAEQSLPVKPIDVLPIGWDSFKPSALADKEVLRRYNLTEKSYILFVGTIEPRKNLATLLDAMEGLRRDLGARVPTLVVVGTYGWRSMRMAKRLWQEPSTRWLSSVRDSELPALYNQALFTVAPSHMEGWGLPVQESIAHGVPCIASSAGALREAGRGLAVHFEPTDRAGLQALMAKWITDGQMLARQRALIRETLQNGIFPSWNDAGQTVLGLAE